MKILMVNLPFSGHTNPTIGLAKELVDKGHKVAYIHSITWKDRIETTGAKFIPYCKNTPQKHHFGEIRYWRIAYDTVDAVLSEYDMLIYEVLFFPGKSLADRHGKPCARLYSTFALNRHILELFGKTGGPYLTVIFRFRWLCQLVSKRIARAFLLPERDMVNELTQNNPPLNFVYTIEDFQIDADYFTSLGYHFIGPSLDHRKTETDINFSALKLPIIYISMGTLINQSKSFYKKCFQAFGNKEMSVIISLGHARKAEDFSSVPANIHLYTSVPQLDVLQKCSLFITHGGMNSVNEAIYYGVPMLAAPVGNDQPAVANRIEELGLGKRIYPKKMSSEDLFSTAIETLESARQNHTLYSFSSKAQKAGGNKQAAKIITDFLKR